MLKVVIIALFYRTHAVEIEKQFQEIVRLKSIVADNNGVRDLRFMMFLSETLKYFTSSLRFCYFFMKRSAQTYALQKRLLAEQAHAKENEALTNKLDKAEVPLLLFIPSDFVQVDG